MKGVSILFAFLVLSLLSAVLISGVNGSTPPVKETKAASGPLILISIDTLRADHLGLYGYPRPTSLRLDDFAKTAIVFDHAYAAEPWTLPSHATILTGLPPEIHQLCDMVRVLDPRIITLAQVFKKAGYHTAGFIDTDLLASRYGFNRGFDVYDEQEGGSSAILPRALKWLQGAGPKSFLFIHIFDCHGPYKSAPEAVRKKFHTEETPEGKKALAFLSRLGYEKYQQLSSFSSLEDIIDAYDSGIAYSDSNVGAFFDQLKQMGIFERSTIAVLSDHGESLFDRGVYVGHSYFLYDEEMHVPFLIKLQNGAGGGHHIPVPVSLASVFQTLTDLAGIRTQQNTLGPSLGPLLRNETNLATPPVFMQSSIFDQTRAVRTPDWKWIEATHVSMADALDALGPENDEVAALLRIRIQTGEQLFSMNVDRAEQHNLASEKRALSSFFEDQLALYKMQCERRAKEIKINVVPLSPEEREELESLGYVAH